MYSAEGNDAAAATAFAFAAIDAVTAGVGGSIAKIALKGSKALSEVSTGAKAGKIGQFEYINLASEYRTNHILYGNSKGSGGHLYSIVTETGSDKTPFPKNWTPEKIMHEVSDIATDPHGLWIPDKKHPGRYNVIAERDGITIKVVTDGIDIITAFPLYD